MDDLLGASENCPKSAGEGRSLPLVAVVEHLVSVHEPYGPWIAPFRRFMKVACSHSMQPSWKGQLWEKGCDAVTGRRLGFSITSFGTHLDAPSDIDVNVSTFRKGPGLT